MSPIEWIAAIVLSGSIVGWLFHRRSSRAMTLSFKMLALERDGELSKTSFFTLPKLHFIHAGHRVEVSSASTGISGDSERYTYVLFSGLDFKGLGFRILPKSIQTAIDEKLGVRKAVYTGDAQFDQMCSLSANDRDLMLEILTDGIRSDLLSWANVKPQNGITDIRNYDDRLMFSVREIPGDLAEYRRLLRSAIAFHDALTDVLERLDAVPEPRKV